jgi:hypothetical protein
MRNLWGIMTKFNVLPTNEDFRNLSDVQIDMMIYSMQEDYREMELAKKGVQVDSQHYDSSFEDEVWNKDVGDWEVLKDGHDPNDIARQVDELTKAEDRKNLAMKFDSLDDYNAYLEAGGKTTRESEVEQYINKQLALAEEKAQRYAAMGGKKLESDTEKAGERDNLPDLDKEAMAKSIALFNQKNNDDDDDFTML